MKVENPPIVQHLVLEVDLFQFPAQVRTNIVSVFEFRTDHVVPSLVCRGDSDPRNGMDRPRFSLDQPLPQVEPLKEELRQWVAGGGIAERGEFAVKDRCQVGFQGVRHRVGHVFTGSPRVNASSL